MELKKRYAKSIYERIFRGDMVKKQQETNTESKRVRRKAYKVKRKEP